MTEIIPQKGDIYWADLNPGTGSEQSGYRPVVIVSNNLANKSTVLAIVPMTRKTKQRVSNDLNIFCATSDCTMDNESIKEIGESGHRYVHNDSIIIANQARVCSKERLIAKIGYINKTPVIAALEKGLSLVFGINVCQVCGFPAFEGKKFCINKSCKATLRRQCTQCDTLFDLNYKFCPQCGKGV